VTLATHSTLDWVLIILALIAFTLATANVNVGSRPVNLTAAGLLLLTLTLITA